MTSDLVKCHTVCFATRATQSCDVALLREVTSTKDFKSNSGNNSNKMLKNGISRDRKSNRHNWI